jgi:hypothetical protein
VCDQNARKGHWERVSIICGVQMAPGRGGGGGDKIGCACLQELASFSHPHRGGANVTPLPRRRESGGLPFTRHRCALECASAECDFPPNVQVRQRWLVADTMHIASMAGWLCKLHIMQIASGIGGYYGYTFGSEIRPVNLTIRDLRRR